jgi:hypothetical protein
MRRAVAGCCIKEIVMLDAVHTWERPITIKLGGENVVVTTPAQARNILLIEWPAERTALHKIASDHCLEAMEGADGEPAWMAFMEAAIEAGVFVE